MVECSDNNLTDFYHLLELKDLTVKIESKTILSDVSLEIPEDKKVLLMGPNGAGKSSLLKAIIGWYDTDVEGSIKYQSSDITRMDSDGRAREQIYYGHQSPVEVPGVHFPEFLRLAHNSIHPDQKYDPISFNDILSVYIDKLNLPSEFLNRGLNEGFSGGEKKKAEILQMLVLKPSLAMLDEVDSGIDIDSLDTAFSAINEYQENSGATVILVSHNPRILKYYTPDIVIQLGDKSVKEVGGLDLAKKILKNGY